MYDGCACQGGYKGEEAPRGRIDTSRMIGRLDACFEANDLEEATRVLEYWHREALALNDMRGELSVISEALGLYRKTGNEKAALSAVSRSLFLIDTLDMGNTLSAATVLLNAATTLKAFGRAAEALPLYERTYAVYSRDLEKDDERLGGFYNNYGLALADLSRKEEAESAFFSALEIMEDKGKGLLEGAVTHLNLAHLYELWQDEKIYAHLISAYELLLSPSVPHNGYFIFTVGKCIPSFRHFGLTEEASVLSALEKGEAL